ncbi:MAG: methyltransferase [Pseudomonadota bacterium]
MSTIVSSNREARAARSGDFAKPASPARPPLLRHWRNKLLASPRFQKWSARLPFSRPIARTKAVDLFGLCTGFVHSQVLQACVQLDLFHFVEAEPRSAEEVAALSGLPQEGAERLMKAGAALDLFTPLPGGRYTLGDRGAALLGNPSVFSMIRHHAVLYQDLADPVVLLKQRTADTQLARYWRYSQSDAPKSAAPGEVAAYSELMAHTQDFIAEQVLAAYPFGRHRKIMDIGGGRGAFLAAAGKAHPDLGLMLCDLPAVAALAQDTQQAGGHADRLQVFGLDAAADPLPTGADLVTLIRILHDHDDDRACAILANIRKALPPGGTLLVAEPMAGTKGAEAMGDSYFGLYLWAMGSGRPRTRDELKDMLRHAGFRSVREAKTWHPVLVRCLVAR